MKETKLPMYLKKQSPKKRKDPRTMSPVRQKVFNFAGVLMTRLQKELVYKELGDRDAILALIEDHLRQIEKLLDGVIT